MSRRKRSATDPQPASRAGGEPAAFAVQNPHAAGIDVHSDNHVVCVGVGRVDTFGAYTDDLRAVADHLRAAGVTSVALESTGVYWIPLYELLEERGFEVLLIEPSRLHSTGSRPKTDVHDCQWIQRLHTFGLLKGSFRPPQSVLALRAYHRQRQTLIRTAARHVQHVQKALEQMNVKLTEVLSDVTGLTGTRIIEAILVGERDGRVLARLRSPKCAKEEAEIARALEGVWRDEHLFELRQAYESYQFHQKQAAACDRRIEAELAKLEDRAGDKPEPASGRKGRGKNDPCFPATVPLFKALGVDLTAIEGVSVGTALLILAEIGVDVSRFPTEKAFASWLGLCPKKGRSNRTEKKRSDRKGKNRIAQALRMCAQSVGRTMTPLGMFYRRIKGRLGGRGACTATAHKLARLVYRLLRYGTEYVTRGMEDYAAKLREQMERSLRKKAALLGYQLTPQGEAGPTGRPA